MNYAQELKPSTAAPDDRSSEFKPDRGGAPSADAGTLLVIAYIVMWLIIFGFLALGWRRQRALDTRMTELEKALSQRKESP